MITYDLSKADNTVKTEFITNAQAIHQTTVDGDKMTILYQKALLTVILQTINVRVILFM